MNLSLKCTCEWESVKRNLILITTIIKKNLSKTRWLMIKNSFDMICVHNESPWRTRRVENKSLFKGDRHESA